jgi:MFS family permease
MQQAIARRNLWPLVLGQSVSLLGDYLGFFLALPVFVRDASDGSATALGLLGTFETIAVLGFGLVAGLVIDRTAVRRAMVLADLARAAAFGLLAVAVALDAAEVWMAFAVAFLVGSLGTLFDTGLEGVMPTMLTDDLLVTANARLQIGRNLAQTGGFIIGGLLLATTGGIAAALTLDSATYLVSAIAILLLREIRPRPEPVREPVLASLASGLRTLWELRLVRWATIAAMLVNLAFAPLAAVIPIYVPEELGVEGTASLGLFFAGFAIIGAGGVALSSRVVRLVGLGRTVVLGTVLLGAGATGVGFAHGWIGIVPFGVAAAGVSLSQVGFVTMRQRLTPRDRLGRVIAASRTIAWGAIPVGLMIGTPIADAIGLRALFGAGGLMIVGVTAVLLFSPLWRGQTSDEKEKLRAVSPPPTAYS